MPDYRNMTALEAMRYAKEAAGLTVEELAMKTAIRPASLRRYFQQDDGYMPGLDKLPRLISAFGNTVIMDWLMSQTEVAPDVAPAKNRAEVLTAIARAGASLGDCQRVLANSEEGGIDPVCAREVRSLLSETINLCRRAMAMLAAMASCRNWTETAPLASLKKPARKKWWEVWK